jgi:hypothetical protein
LEADEIDTLDTVEAVKRFMSVNCSVRYSRDSLLISGLFGVRKFDWP